jgi:hypothetical protein
MNWERVEGNWQDFQGKVLQQWSKLTNDDLNQSKADGMHCSENCRRAMASPAKPPSTRSRTGCAGSASRPALQLREPRACRAL